jgi:hypothetical protein
MIISGSHYLVEISYNDLGLYISLHSIEGAHKSVMQDITNPERVKQILTAFNNDFEMLARHIKLHKNSIRIRRPEFAEMSNLRSI